MTGLILLGLTPIILGFLTSLTNYDGTNIDRLHLAGETGLGNYIKAFQDPNVGFSLQRTLLWGALNLPLWMGLSFVLALILNQNVKGRGFFRTLYYLPSVIPAAAAMTAWGIIFGQNNGLLNSLISVFRPGTAVPWMTQYALQSVTAIAVWTGLGGCMVIFLAGLQNISEELVEAAKIDGANSWQIFLHITLPLMTPVIFFVLIQGLIGAFQQLTFPLIIARQNTVPPRSLLLYMIYTYQQIFASQRYGYGTALLWLLSIGIAILTFVVFWSQKFWVYQGDADSTGDEA
jgi:multiple sugar transport system permease protein